MRIVLAKLGLDGHDRGIKVVARMLRDAGFEVIYLGLRQTADDGRRRRQQEDADAVGISMHNGGHLTLAPAHGRRPLRAAGLDIPVIVGGIIPDADVASAARRRRRRHPRHRARRPTRSSPPCGARWSA